MSGIRSILEIQVKGTEAIEKAARDVHGLSGYFRSASHNAGRIESAARQSGGAYSGSSWNPSYMMGGTTTPGNAPFSSGYVPSGGAGGGSGGGNGGGGEYINSGNWRGGNRYYQQNYYNMPSYVVGGSGGGYGGGGSGGGSSGSSGGWNPMGSFGRGIGSAIGTTAGIGFGMGFGLVEGAATIAGKALSGFAGLLMKIASPGGALQKLADMMTFSGMISSGQAITQRSFFSNAVGINPNDIMRLNATYGRLADPSGVLSGIASARSAPFSLGLATAGISQQDARSMTTEQLTWRMTDLARNYARNPRWGANEMTLGATGLGQFFSVQDMMRIGNLSEEEYGEIRSTSQRVESASKLKDPGAWRHFETERAVGMAGMETAIQNKMTRLLVPVEQLINNMTKMFSKAGGGNVLDKLMSASERFVNELNRLMQAGSMDEFWSIMKEDAKITGEYVLGKAKESWDFVWNWAKEKFPETTKMLEEAFISVLEFTKPLKELVPSFDEIKIAAQSASELFTKAVDILVPSFANINKAAEDAQRIFEGIKEWMVKFNLIPSAEAAPIGSGGLPADVPGSLNKGSDFNLYPAKPKIPLGPIEPEMVQPEEYSDWQQSEITGEDIDNLRRMYQSAKPGPEKQRLGKMLADAIKSQISKKPFNPSEGSRSLDGLRERKGRGDREARGRPISLGSDDSTVPGTVISSVPRDARVDIAIRTDNSANFMLQSMRTSGSIFGGGSGY